MNGLCVIWLQRDGSFAITKPAVGDGILWTTPSKRRRSLKRSLETAAATGKSLGGSVVAIPKISIILDNNRNPWNLCIQNRDIPFWSCLSPPDTLPLPASSFTYWHNKIPVSQKISPASTNRAPTVFQVFRVFRVFQVFQVFQFRFWTKKTPIFLVQIGTKQVFHVFCPKEKLLTKRVRDWLMFTHPSPLFFYRATVNPKKRHERLIFPIVWWLFRMWVMKL